MGVARPSDVNVAFHEETWFGIQTAVERLLFVVMNKLPLNLNGGSVIVLAFSEDLLQILCEITASQPTDGVRHLRGWELCATSCHQCPPQARVRSARNTGWPSVHSQNVRVSACQGQDFVSGCLH